jgi:hypothetical protein
VSIASSVDGVIDVVEQIVAMWDELQRLVTPRVRLALVSVGGGYLRNLVRESHTPGGRRAPDGDRTAPSPSPPRTRTLRQRPSPTSRNSLGDRPLAASHGQRAPVARPRNQSCARR